MASHGIFSKDAPHHQGKRGGRNQSYSQHDDRTGDNGGWNNSRGRGGPTRGRWTRGGRNNRGNTSRGRGYQQHQNDYNREEGGSSYRGYNREEGGSSYRGYNRGEGGSNYRGYNRGGRGKYRGNKGDRGGFKGESGASGYHDNYYDNNNDGDYFNDDSSNQSNKGKNRYNPYQRNTQRERGGSRGGANKHSSVFDRLGGKSGKGKEFGRLVRNNGRPDNERRVSFQSMDNDSMEEDTSSVLLNVLGERYDSLNMSLNLSDMFHDKTLQDNRIRGSMFDVGFVNNILELISFHCSSLNALDISRNKLQRLQAYSNLKDKCPSLKILDISDNELHHINELEHLAPMPSVTTLVLENNPFKGHVNDFASYAGQVRAYFPNLEILDGQALPGPVKFDLPTSIGMLPPSQKGYLVNEEVRSLVIQFLELFYSVYDGENRDKLLEAYSDNAVFSLSVNFTEQQRGPPFHQYMQLSRNLARQNSSKKSLLHHGRIDIVQCLRQLPHSCHIASSFNVDVLKASPSCTVFTVHGVFGEASSGKSDSYVVRAFSRTFVIIATGTGVTIVNDQLTLRNANFETAKQHMNSVQAHFSKSSSSQLITGPPHASTKQLPVLPSFPLPQQQQPQPFIPQRQPVIAISPYNNQDEMIHRISNATGMNLEYSKKCLAENGWIYDKAIAAFKFIQEQGKIPFEAFHRQ